MRNRIFAISILLSFLAVFIHEMIPHHHSHHHEVLALNFSVSIEHEADHKHKHHQEEGHQHHHDSEEEEKKKKHNHPFPFHQHISTASDIFIKRPNLFESNTRICDVSFFVLNGLFRIRFYKPAKLEGRLYEELPFLISSICNLEAFALRGPPAIV